MTGILIVFPWPDSRLNPNSSKRHWRSKAAATKEARAEAFSVALGEKRAMEQEAWCAPMFPWEHCRAHIAWYPPTGRRRDYGNLLSALKPIFDGIVDAGLIVDDSTGHLVIGRLTLAKPDAVKPRVEIVLLKEEI